MGLGGGGSTMSRMFNTVLIALEIVGWDMPKMLARVRRLSVVSVQAISGAGSIEYFVVFHTYYKYTTGLVFLFFRG